jgi:hypothetical protein
MPCREAVRPTRLANGQLFFVPTSMEQEYRQCDLAPVGYENGIQGLHITGTCIGGLGSPLSRRKGRPDDIPGVTRSMKEDWTRHLGLQSSHPQVPRPSLKPKLEKESEGRLAVAFPRISGGPVVSCLECLHVSAPGRAERRLQRRCNCEFRIEELVLKTSFTCLSVLNPLLPSFFSLLHRVPGEYCQDCSGMSGSFPSGHVTN